MKNKHYKPVSVFIPRNLDLKKLLKENRPEFNFHIDNFKYLVSLITEIPSFNKDIQELNFTPFYSPLVQRKVHDYLKYLDYLIK